MFETSTLGSTLLLPDRVRKLLNFVFAGLDHVWRRIHAVLMVQVILNADFRSWHVLLIDSIAFLSFILGVINPNSVGSDEVAYFLFCRVFRSFEERGEIVEQGAIYRQ